MKINLTIRLFYIRKWLLIPIMRTFIFLFCTSIFSFTPNNVCSQNVRIIVSEDTLLSVNEVFDIIDRQTDYKFLYHADLFKNVPKVRLKKGTILANRLLQLSLASGNFSNVLTKNNTIVIKPKGQQVQRLISGTVSDNLGVPMSGATVIIKGTGTGTTTDFNGNYSLAVPDAQNVLIFSFLGFANQEIIVGNKTTINVTLKEELSKLDEVTINAGYYTVSERERTGNISKIEAHTIEKQPVANPLAAMQGRMTGVQITQNTGVAGGNYKVLIRGQNSLRLFDANANHPLYIVDGVPFSSSSLGFAETSGQIYTQGISPLTMINPNVIASIEVLKDADATAIYGSRGANGVVLITTKKGNQGKTTFDVNFYSSLGKISNTMAVLNTEQYLEMRHEGLTNDGSTPQPSDYDLTQWDQNRHTNWQEKLIGGTAETNNIQMTFSGGDATTNFLMSGSHRNETSVFPGDYKDNRTTALLKVNHASEDKRISLSGSAHYSSKNTNLPTIDLTSLAVTLPPNAPELYTAEGELNWENSTWTNPLSFLNRGYTAKSNTLIGNASFNYYVTKSFDAKVDVGYTILSYKAIAKTPKSSFNPALEQSVINSTYFSSREETSWVFEPQLHWKKYLGKGKINLLIGASFQSQGSTGLAQLGRGFSNEHLMEDIKSASNVYVTSNSDTQYRYQALFGRFNYNYKGTYLLNVTGRRDGSSRFGAGKRWANFGAVGAAWVFSNEKVIKSKWHFLDYGKLRASYGITGNDKIGDYGYLDSYTSSSTYLGVNTLIPARLSNPLFAWEENKKFELGMSLSVCKNALNVEANYYSNTSSNQLVGITLPGAAGFTSVNGNLPATLRNSGYELAATSTLINKANFGWIASLNLTIPQSKLLAFPNIESSTYDYFYEIGKPLELRKVYTSEGVDPSTGIYQFKDTDSSGTLDIKDRKGVLVGQDFYGGFSNNIQYKGFQFDIHVQFVKQHGNAIENSISSVPGFSSNQPTHVLNRWQSIGEDSSVQRFTGNFSPAAIAFYNWMSSESSIVDTSFLRFKNISLTYTFSEFLVQDLGLKSAKLFVRGTNIFTLTSYKGLDPETSSSGMVLPPLKSITTGIALTF